ncbi:MAG: 3-isopropylmalate dehydratase small subunit [Terriglobales bacterium]
MQPFTQLRGVVAPLDRANVDTDQIIPKQFLKVIRRTGLGEGLFYAWRRLPSGEPDPGFVLNQPAYQHAQILLARENFGCGSSREHAPWALLDFGIRAILAPSFADIFANNCLQNGMLALPLPAGQIDELFQAVGGRPGMELTIDLPAGQLRSEGWSAPFQFDDYRRQRLIAGLDDIALTLQQEAAITAYEGRHAGA